MVFYVRDDVVYGIYDLKSSQRADAETHERIYQSLFGDAPIAPTVFSESEDTVNIYKTELFKYMEGVMVKDAPTAVTVRDVSAQRVEVQGKSKTAIVMHFKESDKGAILNKTNAKALAEVFGPETDEWKGQKVELYAEKGTAFGKTGYWLRIKPAGKKVNTPMEIDDIPWGDFEADDTENGKADIEQIEMPLEEMATALNAFQEE
jgi:hypothetical protein